MKAIFSCLSILFILSGNLAFAQSKTTVEWDTEHHLKADIYQPDGAGQHPAVLLIHGGGWMAGNKGELEWFGNNLAANGMVAISIDYRLVNENTTANAQYADIKNALQAIIRNPEYLRVDTDRIAVLGGSAGGHLAAMLATEPNTPLKAAVLLWSPTNLVDVSNVSAQGKQILHQYFQHSPQIDKAAFSPYLRLNPSMCKNWLLIHGDQDELVPPSQSTAMQSKLEAFGVQSKLIMLPGMSHAPTSTPSTVQAMNELLVFLKNKLTSK